MESKLNKDEIKRRLSSAVAEKNYAEVAECYRALAELGDAEAQYSLAKMLEEGTQIARDDRAALGYYRAAALQNHPKGAYGYSRLISRDRVGEGSFWLIYSAVLGCPEAYAGAAREYSRISNERAANHFYTLASECEDKEATLTLAKRYCEGIGFDAPSDEYAKWYVGKYKILPLYAIPLAWKLRGVKAKEPPSALIGDYNAFLRSVARQAIEYGYDTATLHLCAMLAKRGDLDALASLGMMQVKGVGCTGLEEDGLRTLRECAVRGSADAYMLLGELYLEGKYIKRDVGAAIFNYERAARLGRADALEALGDIYTSNEDGHRDFAKGYSCYTEAARLGIADAERKANGIKNKREEIFAAASLASTPERAFRLYAVACAMGHDKSALKLAECYERGIGTAVERQSAFYWYVEASRLGVIEALYPLGRCYFEGIGTDRDYELARAVLMRALKHGDTRADKLIRLMYERKKKKLQDRIYSTAMRLVHIGKFTRAVEHLEIAEELAHPKAIYSLGCLYEFGIGVPCDKERAYAMYERAQKLAFRDPRAQFKLSILRKVKKNLR